MKDEIPTKEILLFLVIMCGLIVNKSYENKQQKLWKQKQVIQSKK